MRRRIHHGEVADGAGFCHNLFISRYLRRIWLCFPFFCSQYALRSTQYEIIGFVFHFFSGIHKFQISGLEFRISSHSSRRRPLPEQGRLANWLCFLPAQSLYFAILYYCQRAYINLCPTQIGFVFHFFCLAVATSATVNPQSKSGG